MSRSNAFNISSGGCNSQCGLGVPGPMGPVGPQGVTGPSGFLTGATGPQGPIGPAGPQGFMGMPGVAGATGPQGIAGSTGIDGTTGPTGPSGLSASINIGVTGQTGPATAIYDTLLIAPNLTLEQPGNTGSTVILSCDVSGAIAEYLTTQPPAPTKTGQVVSSTSITFQWQQFTPPQVASSFAVAPSSLGPSFDFFPYIDDFQLKVTQGTGTPVTFTKANIGGLSFNTYVQGAGKPNSLKQIVLTNTNSASSSLTLDSTNDALNLAWPGAVAGTFTVTFGYTNQSAGTPNVISWNNIVFGNFGPAYPPASIAFSNASYKTLTIGGDLSGARDQSLNTVWSATSLRNGYYVDVSYGLRPDPNAPLKFSNTNTSSSIRNLSGGFVADPANGDVGQNWTNTTLNTNAFPEFLFSTMTTPAPNSYYGVNSSADFSATIVRAAANVSDAKYLPIPTRNQAVNNTGYTQTINSSGSSSAFHINNMGTSILDGSGFVSGSWTNASAWARHGGAGKTIGLVFLRDSSHAVLTQTAGIGLQNNIGTPVSAPIGPTNADYLNTGSVLGNLAHDASLSQLGMSCSGAVATVSDLSSNWRVGYTGNDSAEIVANSGFQFEVSETKEAGDNSDPRNLGYYLGFDVSNIEISGNLTRFPDVSNNGYNPYTISLSQTQKDSAGNFTTTSITNTQMKPARYNSLDISSSNFAYSWAVPPQNDHLFGLNLLNGDFTVTTAFDLNDLNDTWGTLSGNNPGPVCDVDVSINRGTSWLSIHDKTETWADLATNPPTDSDSVSTTLTVDYPTDYSQRKFFKDISSQQFEAGGKVYNNVGQSSSITNNFSSSAVDISFGGPSGKRLWWDFTFNNLGTNANFAANSIVHPDPNPGPTNIPALTVEGTGAPSANNVSLRATYISSASPGLTPYDSSYVYAASGPTGYDMSIQCPSGQAMWANNAWYGAGTVIGNVPDAPYSDYTVYHGQTRDYSPLDSIGTPATIDMSYGALVFQSSSTPIKITYTDMKWIMLKCSNVPSTNSTPPKLIVDISGARSTFSEQALVLSEDYVLFYQEEASGSNNAQYVWKGGSQFGYSPWLDAANNNIVPAAHATFEQGQETGNGGGTYGAGNGIGVFPSSGAPAYIQRLSPSTVNQYIAIGIPETVASSSGVIGNNFPLRVTKIRLKYE